MSGLSASLSVNLDVWIYNITSQLHPSASLPSYVTLADESARIPNCRAIKATVGDGHGSLHIPSAALADL